MAEPIFFEHGYIMVLHGYAYITYRESYYFTIYVSDITPRKIYTLQLASLEG